MRYPFLLSISAASAISLGKRQAPCPVISVPEPITITVQVPLITPGTGDGPSPIENEATKTVFTTVTSVAQETQFITIGGGNTAPGHDDGSGSPVTIVNIVTVTEHDVVTVTVYDNAPTSPFSTSAGSPQVSSGVVLTRLAPSQSTALISEISVPSGDSTTQSLPPPTIGLNESTVMPFYGTTSSIQGAASMSSQSSKAGSLLGSWSTFSSVFAAGSSSSLFNSASVSFNAPKPTDASTVNELSMRKSNDPVSKSSTTNPGIWLSSKSSSSLFGVSTGSASSAAGLSSSFSNNAALSLSAPKPTVFSVVDAGSTRESSDSVHTSSTRDSGIWLSSKGLSPSFGASKGQVSTGTGGINLGPFITISDDSPSSGRSSLQACPTYVYDSKTFTEYITDPFYDGTSTVFLDASTTTLTLGPQATAAVWKRQQLNLPIADIEDTLAPVVSLLDPIISPVTSALEPIISPLTRALDPVVQEVNSIGNGVITAVNPLVTPVISLLDPVLSALNPIISIADPALSIVISALLPGITPVPSILEPVASGAANILNPVLSAIEPVITGILAPVNSILEPVESGLLSIASPIVSLVQPIETAVLQPVASIVSNVVGNVTDIAYPLVTPVLSAVLSEVTSLVVPPVVPIVCELVASDVEHGLLGLNAGCPQTLMTSSSQTESLGSISSGSISTTFTGVGVSAGPSSAPCTTRTITVLEIKTVYKNQAGQVIPATSTLTTSGCENSTQTVYVLG